jgi:hypothetical protein
MWYYFLIKGKKRKSQNFARNLRIFLLKDLLHEKKKRFIAIM